MKVLLQIVSGIVFLQLLLVFLLLTTAKFQLLHQDFILTSFRQNAVYERVPGLLHAALIEQGDTMDNEEKQAYLEIVKKITPETAQSIVEANIKEILLFLNGASTEIIIYFPVSKLGIPVEKEFTDDKIPLITLAPNFPPTHLAYMQQVGHWVLIAWAVVAGSFAFSLYGLIRKRQGIILLLCALITGLGSLLGKFLAVQMSRDFQVSREPAHHLLGMLTSSIIPDIFTTWIAVSLVLGIVGIVLLLLQRKGKA